jgi:hypothetical protein
LKIYDKFHDESYFTSLADLTGDEDQTFATPELARVYLASFIGGFKSASGGSEARNIIQETDSVLRTFTGTYAIGKTWSVNSFRANSKLLLDCYIPAINLQSNSVTSVKIEYCIDGGLWVVLGEAGYYGSVNTASGIAQAHTNNFLFDPEMDTDFDIQFRFSHKATIQTTTAYVNKEYGQSGDMFQTHFKIEEITA